MRIADYTLLKIGLLIVLLASLGAWAFDLVEDYAEEKSDDFIAVVPGRLYRSDQPLGRMRLMLKRYGIRTVVDLRLPDEDPVLYAKEQRRCAAAGAKFIAMPVGAVIPSDEQIVQFLHLVLTEPPVLVHCAEGRSRTGIMVAAYRIVVQGWSARRAWDGMVYYGYHFKKPGQRGYEDQQQRTALLRRIAQHRREWLDAARGQGPPR